MYDNLQDIEVVSASTPSLELNDDPGFPADELPEVNSPEEF